MNQNINRFSRQRLEKWKTELGNKDRLDVPDQFSLQR